MIKVYCDDCGSFFHVKIWKFIYNYITLFRIWHDHRLRHLYKSNKLFKRDLYICDKCCNIN